MKKTILILATIVCFKSKMNSQTYTIGTIAGTTTCGYSGDGGLATQAQFAGYAGILADSTGNIYIADYPNSCIRKINKVTGIVTTIAGNGTSGFSGDGGPAINAQMGWPGQMVFNPNGTAILFHDPTNNRVRKIDLITGIITTVFGNGNPGTVVQNVVATASPLFGGKNLTYNANGDLYMSVGSTGDCAVYKIDKITNIVTRVVGNGTQTQSGDGGLATAAGLNQPKGIAFDANGNLYLTDFTNRIRKVNGLTGIITTVVGSSAGFSGDGGLATAAKINGPERICFDNNNNLLIDDAGNNRIRIVNLTTGIINTFAGTGVLGGLGDGGPATQAQISTNLSRSFYGNSFYTTGNCRLREIKLNGPANLIFGNVFVDCNNNCTKQPNETYAPGAAQIVATNGTNTYTTLPNAYGNYSFNGLTSGIYTITPSALTNYAICSGASFTANVTATTNLAYNFAVKEISAPPVDYSSLVKLSNGLPGPGAVPGGTISIHAYNSMINASSCTTISPTKIKIILPPNMSFGTVIGSTVAPSAIITATTGDTIVWNNPLPFDVHHFTAVTATNAVIGNNYCIKAIVYPLSDYNPLNNTSSVCKNYGGPFDPNEKTSDAIGMASNGDILSNTTDLTYTLRFQNLGTAPSVNVLIKDTIDLNLDINSIQILSSSFPVQTQVNTNTREVNFRFNTIFLPAASVNEPASHGYVQYKINLNPSLPQGTVIKNRGHIYFDYNAAVSTNQTINTIVMVTGINNNELNRSTSIYPNPTNNNIFITSSSNILKLEVINHIGQVVFVKENINSTNTSVDMQNLSHGIYFVQLQTTAGLVNKKVIKE